MKKKAKLKNPVQIVRKPEEINKEYSEAVITLGKYAIDLEGIARAEIKQFKRRDEIAEAKAALFERIDELSAEMSEAQNKINSDAKAKEAAMLEETKKVSNENAEASA